MATDKLIRMATQMADFFRNQPDHPAPEAVAEHINQFWSYQMRRDFIAQIRAGAQADPIVSAAADFITLPQSAE
ncbi:formate dehydrogenase subunit delta [Paracoccus sp. DMF-8]|uniref:formate dehydrogenase subunit delta n=1 Tax=Paracoccus sp. DMF-8 TaxID=3019445 RepID=UPI0023E7D254|nr:formate dehydrogenase subunit delta [Paracoccus sp. DMF-8]MDF3605652.1 formate dehydrogenase subunit delta [Paracoccus sp. DMF-8]